MSCFEYLREEYIAYKTEKEAQTVVESIIESTETKSTVETSNVKEFVQVDNKLFEKVYIKDGEENDTYILMPVED